MGNKKGRILIVDDNEELLIALRLFLSPHFSEIITKKNPNLIPSLIPQNFDVILLDMNFKAGINTGNEGFYWMKEILKFDSSAIIVFITAYSDVEMAVKAIKEGAADFIQKSWDEHKILSTLLSAYQLRQSKLEITKLKTKHQHLSQNIQKEFVLIKGKSPKMENLYETINKVSNTKANILLLGENGSGKEVIAREIHRLSDRKDELFVSVDLGALSESLFESELFGHTKGSFTDAKQDRAGRFEVASGGTLFLDEIGNLSLPLQAKLLSAIQNEEIVKIGSNQTVAVDIRLICATNKNLHKMLEKGEFREDLLYRINTIQIDIPSLRERLEDIPILSNYFLDIFKTKYKKPKLKIRKTALEQLSQHPWPGNIRELRHSIEKAVIMAEKSELYATDFYVDSKQSLKLKEQQSFNIAENEKQLIQKAIARYNGNLSLTAKNLGINRSTLYDKMRKYDL